MPNKVLRSIPARGLEIRTADQLQDSSSCLICDGADLRMQGAARKLPGYEELGMGGVADGFELAYRDDEAVLFTEDGGLYSRNEAADDWERVATVPHGKLRIYPQAAERGEQRNATLEVRDDFALSVWLIDTGGSTALLYSVSRRSDGRVVVPARTIESNVDGQPVVASDAGGFVIVYSSGGYKVSAVTVQLGTWEQAPPVFLGITAGPRGGGVDGAEDYAIDRYAPERTVVIHREADAFTGVVASFVSSTLGLISQTTLTGTVPDHTLHVSSDDPDYNWTNEPDIVNGLGVLETAPASSNLDLQAGSGVTLGGDAFSLTALTIDTTVDELSAPTTVTTPGNERWLMILAGVGGVRVVQAAEAVVGTALRPPYDATDLCLADARLIHGTAVVQEVNTVRRQSRARLRPRIAVTGILGATATGTDTTLSLYDSALEQQGTTITANDVPPRRLAHATQRGAATLVREVWAGNTTTEHITARLWWARYDYSEWLTARTDPATPFPDAPTTGAVYEAALSNQPRYTPDGSTLWLWYYVPATSSNSGCLLLLDVFAGVIHARAYEGGRAQLVQAGAVIRANLPHMRWDGVELLTGANYRTFAGLGVTGFVDAAIGLMTWQEHDADMHPESSRGHLYWAPAGFVATYDGREVAEVGWHSLPEIDVEVIAGSGPGAGTYGVAVYWVWEDRDGEISESGSALESVVLAASERIQITIYGAPPTARAGVRIGIARTDTNGSVYHSVLDPGLDLRPVPGGTVVYVDSLDNPALLTRPIYAQSGDGAILANDPTAAAGFVVALRDRLWFGDSELPDLIHYSLPFASGETVYVNPRNVQQVPTASERVTAMAEQDGTLYAFSSSRVAYFGGEGPDNRGVGAPYQAALDLRAPSGTPNQRQVANTAATVIYGTPRGPRALGRDRAAINPFGAVNEAFRFQGQTISAVVYDPGREETTIYAPEPNQPLLPVAWTPRTLRYAHGPQRWSSERYADALAAARSLSGAVAFLRASDRVVCRYTPDSYQRGTHRGSLVVSTAWLGAGPEQEMTPLAIGIKGRHLSGHTLRVLLAYNDDDVVRDSFTINPDRDGVRDVPTWEGNASESWGGGATPSDPSNVASAGGWGAAATPTGETEWISRYHFRIYLAPSRARNCHSIRVIVWDVDGDAAAFALTMIEVLVDVGTDPLRDIDRRLSYGGGDG